MAKKKKRPADKPAQPKAPKEPAPFQAPFAGLKQALNICQPPAPAAPAASPAPGEEALFAVAMTGVAPLGGDGRKCREPAPEPAPPYLDKPLDEDLEVMAQLADLVSGQAEFDLRFSDEYVQGCLPGVGEELKERLARGDFPIQDYLDLHGFDREGAFAALENFLRAAVGRGLRHVLIVHGKGQGSPEGEPVLKRAVAAWLMRKRLRQAPGTPPSLRRATSCACGTPGQQVARATQRIKVKVAFVASLSGMLLAMTATAGFKSTRGLG